MGNGMSQVLPGLYVGNIRDAQDVKQLDANSITHIMSIHDNPKQLIKEKQYLCILASDTPSQNLHQFFPVCNDFIHNARLNGGCVLIHCLCGISRSVTVTAAYIMSITGLSSRDAVNAVRGAREVANPNYGFQKQLYDYERSKLHEERMRLRQKYSGSMFKDEQECRKLLVIYHSSSRKNDSHSSSQMSSSCDNNENRLSQHVNPSSSTSSSNSGSPIRSVPSRLSPRSSPRLSPRSPLRSRAIDPLKKKS